MTGKLRTVIAIATVIATLAIGNVGVADEPRSLNERGVRELVRGLKYIERALERLKAAYELKGTDLAAYNLGRAMVYANRPCEAAQVFMQALDLSLDHESGSSLSRLELAKKAWESMSLLPTDGCDEVAASEQ